jgi:glycine C-acetyltransferase
MEHAAHFRARMSEAGFDLLPGDPPIIPVMLRDPKLAQEMAARLDEKSVYVAPFSFPVVPRGQDRIRTQMSAALSREELDRAIDAFIDVGRDMGIIT